MNPMILLLAAGLLFAAASAERSKIIDKVDRAKKGDAAAAIELLDWYWSELVDAGSTPNQADAVVESIKDKLFMATPAEVKKVIASAIAHLHERKTN